MTATILMTILAASALGMMILALIVILKGEKEQADWQEQKTNEIISLAQNMAKFKDKLYELEKCNEKFEAGIVGLSQRQDEIEERFLSTDVQTTIQNEIDKAREQVFTDWIHGQRSYSKQPCILNSRCEHVSFWHTYVECS